MGAGGIPSGGVAKIKGKMGSLPRFGVKPNSRIDLYNEEGKRIQSRWFDSNGIAFRNRDYDYTGLCEFPHDHLWSPYNETFFDKNGDVAAFIVRGRDHIASDYINYPSDEE